MEKTRTIVKKICVVSTLNEFGIQKEVNIIKEGERLYYHLGTWTINNRKCLDEYMLSEKEMKIFLKEIDHVQLKETEIEKFQKDLLQQSHNGGIDIKKEKLL